MKKVLLGIAALLLLAVGGAALWYRAMVQRVEAFEQTAVGDASTRSVTIPKGTDAPGVGVLLERAHVISSAEDFHTLLRLRKLNPRFKAGEYEFTGALNPVQVIAKVEKGEVKLHHFTVAEGLRCEEIMPAVASGDLGLSVKTLLALCTDKAFAHEQGIPSDRLEGYLFPDTYSFPKGVGEQQVVEKMIARAREEYARAEGKRSKDVALEMHQAMTLASIIEKETGNPEERPRISCLFHNRLKRHIRLQTDPTVLYGMYAVTGKFDRDLAFHGFVAARETKNGYNTYLLGLPVGPICSPGAAAIQAALAPARCSDLFFVADGTGRHTFCPDLACHEAAIRHYVASKGH
jgi:UPF0755 protein